ncbi:hypothetical protein NDU88_003991 [Pleurodeles waltl]|uniref:Uncharacterized protein n=1 Tax=Pleurodeles waltl TaxID=8319 RepID=A0AAV7TS75_PLEWA|nr:hypothetical protein NDU88_003991 [Pleurodeles waltl]
MDREIRGRSGSTGWKGGHRELKSTVRRGVPSWPLAQTLQWRRSRIRTPQTIVSAENITGIGRGALQRTHLFIGTQRWGKTEFGTAYLVTAPSVRGTPGEGERLHRSAAGDLTAPGVQRCPYP